MWVYPWHVSANIYSTINTYRVYKLFGPGVWFCSYRILNFRMAVKQSFLFLFHWTYFFEYFSKGFVHTSKNTKMKAVFQVT